MGRRQIIRRAHIFGGITKKKIRVPTLVIYGEYGMGVAVEDALGKICKKVTTLKFKESGHYPAEEQPGKFEVAVIRYLRS